MEWVRDYHELINQSSCALGKREHHAGRRPECSRSKPPDGSKATSPGLAVIDILIQTALSEELFPDCCAFIASLYVEQPSNQHEPRDERQL